uniref:Uncharacterized protein n=1 Tax=Arundo donax TaxID=35708 RepID=A0A0A9GEJ4_ARUDO
MPISDVLHLHWLYPEKQLSDGLRYLLDDSVFKVMLETMSECEAADIYIEDISIKEGQDDNQETDLEYEMAKADDEDYREPTDQDSSVDDEEAQQLRKLAKEIKRNIRAKKLGVHSSQVGETNNDALVTEDGNLQDDGSPYYNSSDDYSYDENSEGETIRWKSTHNRLQ